MTTHGRVPVSVLSPAIQAAVANLHAAFRHDPTYLHVQVTFDYVQQPERVPTIDVVRAPTTTSQEPV